MPFLDLKLLDVAMTLPPEYKHPRLTPRRMEKELLRRAFDIKDDDGFGHVKEYLPNDILWRQKEQFSDGVGYSWIDTLKVHAESCVTDEEWEDRHECTLCAFFVFFFRDPTHGLQCTRTIRPRRARPCFTAASLRTSFARRHCAPRPSRSCPYVVSSASLTIPR